MEPSAEDTDGGQVPSEACVDELVVCREACEVIGDVPWLDVLGLKHCLCSEVLGEVSQVSGVCDSGVVAQAAFDAEEGEEACDGLLEVFREIFDAWDVVRACGHDLDIGEVGFARKRPAPDWDGPSRCFVC